MSELARVEEGGRPDLAELMSGVEVVSRRLGERRPARWVGAAIDVLASLPSGPHTRVASLWVPGSSTYATAVVYERCPQAGPPAGRPAAHSRSIQLLIKRARELGADAIVIHAGALGAGDSPANFGIH